MHTRNTYIHTHIHTYMHTTCLQIVDRATMSVNCWWCCCWLHASLWHHLVLQVPRGGGAWPASRHVCKMIVLRCWLHACLLHHLVLQMPRGLGPHVCCICAVGKPGCPIYVGLHTLLLAASACFVILNVSPASAFLCWLVFPTLPPFLFCWCPDSDSDSRVCSPVEHNTLAGVPTDAHC